MTYPLKIQQALTQVCIDINDAKNLEEIDHLTEFPELLERNGYTFPSWIRAWMKMLGDDSLLNAEEHFHKPKVKIPAFSSMVPKYVNNNSIEIIKVNSAINAICSIPNSPQRNALFVIASQILSNSIEDNPLAFEWHCKTDDTQSLSNKNNFALFIKILEREIDFWQDFQKSRSNPPPKIKLQPSAQNF